MPQDQIAYLVVSSAMEKKEVDGRKLVDISVALKLLPDAGPDSRDGVGDRVHCLDLGRLESTRMLISCLQTLSPAVPR